MVSRQFRESPRIRSPEPPRPRFTTPALTATTSYWARATNAAGTADSTAATITVNPPVPYGAGPFKVGETVTIDLASLYGAGESLKLVGKLPKGLKLNLATGEITGTVTGLAGTYPMKFNVLQGKTLLRTVDFPIIIAGSAYFTGQYDSLLESNAGIPAGAFKLLFKKANTWSATLESPGAKARKAAGKLTLSPGSTAGTSPRPSPPAAAPRPSRSTPRSTSKARWSPAPTTAAPSAASASPRTTNSPRPAPPVSLVFEAGVHDGMTAPAGLGWANGSIGILRHRHLQRHARRRHRGQPPHPPVRHRPGPRLVAALRQHQLLLRRHRHPARPRPDPGRRSPAHRQEFGGSKAPDPKSLSYPLGFPAMEVTVGSSTWTVPATATALGASLGWLNNGSPAVEIDGAGLSNAAPQLTSPTLPTGFTLDASFNLVAPASPSVVPWTGKASAANGTFTGSLTLPTAYVATAWPVPPPPAASCCKPTPGAP